jgi:putative membrane protein (TIGR04086 family)
MVQATLTGLIYALLSGLGMATILGALLYFSPLSQGFLPLLASIIIALAVFWGGLRAARMASGRGLLQGLVVGLLFFLVALAVGWNSGPFVFSVAGKYFAICLLAGAMGGVAGMTGR